MNARKKAKYYKERCKLLETHIPRPNAEMGTHNYYPIVTLYATRIIDRCALHPLMENDEADCSVLNKMLAQQLYFQILNFAKIEIINSPDDYRDKMIFRATLKILDTREEDNNGGIHRAK